MTGDGQSERERRRRAALEQTKRMFENTDKDYGDHTDIDSPVTNFNQDELTAKLDELQDELDSDGGKLVNSE